ncbi:TIM barrel protein [Paenibacillus lycopersici]|uniref:TIM barrel protein n=1 Tax=Paenibacillus lycopersici TaxID=2704462 RepID=A0A6C0G6H8_9BACL|nr:TIM barrel protein [Paenibacillus lycopersici]QHT61185.1 TIM barrel protein [Paenibacillus lycopersici]
MLRFAAHLEMNFGKEVSFADRWHAAADSGFAGCEFVWRQHEWQEVQDLRKARPLQVSCMGGTTGFQTGGGRPLLTRPEDREWLARDVRTAVDYAQRTACPRLIFVPGNLQPGWSIERHRKEAVESLRAIVPIVEEAGVTVVLEPLNSKADHPGIYCDSSAEAMRIVEQVGSRNVKLLYDIYHMQIMEGSLIETIRKHHDLIGYYHVAKVPGRHEPLGGEVNLPPVLEAIAETGYDGFIGLEYSPERSAEEAYRSVKAAYPAYLR